MAVGGLCFSISFFFSLALAVVQRRIVCLAVVYKGHPSKLLETASIPPIRKQSFPLLVKFAGLATRACCCRTGHPRDSCRANVLELNT